MWNTLRAQAAAPFLRLGRGPTFFLAFIALNMLSCAALIGQVLVLHARALGIDTAWVGVLNAILPFAMLVSMFTVGTAERLGSKRLLVSGWTLRNVMAMPMIFTPLAFRWWGTQAAAFVLFAGVALFCLARAMTVIGWSSWQHELVEAKDRGLYFTIESMVSRAVGVLFGVAVFLFFLGKPALWKFSVVSAVGVAAGLVSVRFLTRVPGGGPVASVAQPRSSRAEYRRSLHDREFRPFLLLMCAGTFTNAAQPLLLTLYMREYMALSAGIIMLIGAVAGTLTMLTVRRWARIADSQGSPVTIAAAGFLTVICLFAMGLIGHGRSGTWLIGALAVLLAVSESGFFVAGSRGFMHRIDPAMRHAYVAVWGTANSIAAGVSSILVGLLVRGGGHRAFTLTAIGLGLLMAAACAALLRLPERGTETEANDGVLYDPGQPILSILRMYGYVLRPGPR